MSNEKIFQNCLWTSVHLKWRLCFIIFLVARNSMFPKVSIQISKCNFDIVEFYPQPVNNNSTNAPRSVAPHETPKHVFRAHCLLSPLFSVCQEYVDEVLIHIDSYLGEAPRRRVIYNLFRDTLTHGEHRSTLYNWIFTWHQDQFQKLFRRQSNKIYTLVIHTVFSSFNFDCNFHVFVPNFRFPKNVGW